MFRQANNTKHALLLPNHMKYGGKIPDHIMGARSAGCSCPTSLRSRDARAPAGLLLLIICYHGYRNP